MLYNTSLLKFYPEKRLYLVHNHSEEAGHNLEGDSYIERVYGLIPKPYLSGVIWLGRLATIASVVENAPWTVEIRQYEIDERISGITEITPVTMCIAETTIFNHEMGKFYEGLNNADSVEDAVKVFLSSSPLGKFHVRLDNGKDM